MRTPLCGFLTFAAAICSSWPVSAHGYVGNRFFPATVLVEDPFVADELALPTYSHTKGSGNSGVTTDDFEFEFAKRITFDLALSVGTAWTLEHGGADGSASGFGNVALGAKYQFALEEDDEFVASAGVGVELGGTGSSRLGVEEFNTYEMAAFLGKGFGSASAGWMRPFAVTAFAGLAFPARGKTDDERHVTHANYGGAIEYSLP